MRGFIASAVQLPWKIDHQTVRGNAGRAKIKYITIVDPGAC